MTISTGKPRPTPNAASTGARYYEVFARKDSYDPMTHLGSVEAPNADLAQVRAWYVYDQHSWREMCVVPTDAIVAIDRSGRRRTMNAV